MVPVTIPIFTEIVPANKNDNIIARGSIRHAYMSRSPQPIPEFTLTDRGPFGERCDEPPLAIGDLSSHSVTGDSKTRGSDNRK